MARRSPPRKVTYFQPVPPRLARNTIIESTFDVGRRFRCTMRVDCGRLDPGVVIQPEPGESSCVANFLFKLGLASRSGRMFAGPSQPDSGRRLDGGGPAVEPIFSIRR
jgi:hypothetical protein